MSTRVVAVVGGGITGLAAAWELTQSDDPPRVVVLEGSPTLGGKLRTATVGGQPIDVGAESVLARRREALQLLTEAGLGSAIVHPTSASATIWSRRRHWPLPPRTLMGVPSDPASARGLLTPAEVDRLAHEPALPPVSDDLSVGDFVEARVGPAVVDRLVEPLLAGVYAGHARRLSLRATVPALWAAAVRGDGLVATAARVAAAATTDERAVTVPDERDLARTDRPAPPVFAGFRGGLGHAVVGLTDRLRQAGVDLRTGSTVRALARSATGWTVTVGPTTAPEQLQVDAVVLATPAPATARLLRDVHHAAAAELATIDYASIAIVSLALPRSMEPVVASIMRGSGFLVPPTEPVTIKAATFSASKWEWVNALDPEVVHLRTSVGRAGDTAVLQRDDAELVAVALGDLTRVVGAGLPAPVDTHVQRWGGALPQYAVGHVDLVARVLDGVGTLPGLEVAGAAYDGVGVPACIGSGRAAAGRVLAHLAHRAHLTHLTHRSGPDATLGG
ncbi:MAG: protoporphyrinogen oxidase [Lapillicoccus sp.]